MVRTLPTDEASQLSPFKKNDQRTDTEAKLPTDANRVRSLDETGALPTFAKLLNM